jgi:predicted O-methyltransferase YrrM
VQKYSTWLSTYPMAHFDIIFIDGAHDFFTVYHDIITADNKLCVGGVIILDDVLHKEVGDAVRKFFEGNEIYLKISPSPRTMYAYKKLY